VIAAGFLGIEHFAPPWDVFYLPLVNLLVALYHALFSDFALAIIVFTIVVRTLLAPLFVRQIRSQKEMQRMQPLVREVQRKHKGNRQKVSEETMALYKEHGVSPTAGCLPLLVQMPLLIALWGALNRVANVIPLTPEQIASTEFAGLRQALPGIQEVAGFANNFHAPVSGPCDLPAFAGQFQAFLPINCQLIDPLKLSGAVDTTTAWLFNLDLGRIDSVFGVAVAGFTISGLAILAGILQFVQVKMTSPRTSPDDPTAAATSMTTYLFPIMTVVWGGLFPAGLMIYWVVLTGYIIIHQYLILGWGNLFPIGSWTPAFARGPQEALPDLMRTPRPAGQPSTPRPDAARRPGPSRQRHSGPKRKGRKR
jgi:YidC/Oxa1 family membrane protein insertase